MFSRSRKKYDGSEYKTSDTVMGGDRDHHNILYYKIIAITVICPRGETKRSRITHQTRKQTYIIYINLRILLVAHNSLVKSTIPNRLSAYLCWGKSENLNDSS